jgi:hypothetical protein
MMSAFFSVLLTLLFVDTSGDTSTTCCPTPTKLPALSKGAEWSSLLFNFPNDNESCRLSNLDGHTGCTSYAPPPNSSRVYCSADLVSFNVPNGFLRGCCSKIKEIDINDQPLVGNNDDGKPPKPFTTCQSGDYCHMSDNCEAQACNVLQSGEYNTISVLGFDAVNVFTAWQSVLQLQQKQSWMTFFGAGFEESNTCPRNERVGYEFPFVKLRSQEPPIACARLVLSSFPDFLCPQCGKHGNCMCMGTGFKTHPNTFSLACACDTDDDWYGPNCNIHCERDHGSWNPNTEKCVCNPNYYSEDCSVKCVHGTINNLMKCECSEGWDGDACDTVKVCHPPKNYSGNSTSIAVLSNQPNGCNNHGTCIHSKCVCDTNYAGVFCKIQCPSCQHGGYCDKNVTHKSIGKCVCPIGWEGQNCETSKCATNPDISKQPCSGRGVCTTTNMSYDHHIGCVCRSKYTGQVCDQCRIKTFQPPWCNVCQPGYTSPTTNCSHCDEASGFVRDPKHLNTCVLSDGGGLGGTKLMAVIGVAFVLGILVYCLLRTFFDQGTKDFGRGHFNDPNLGYVKLNGIPGRNSILRSGSSNKQSEPWDDDFLFDFNRLRIGKKIGGGTSGEVFIATWDDATRVAAKRLYAPSVGVSAFDRAFRREVSLLSQLHHPNVVQLLGVCEDTTDGGNTCYIVTELCIGSLRELIDDYSFNLTSTLALRIALQISSGMLYLHEKDVIHRDLKPGNVLVSPANSTGDIQVKLCDFGLSRVKNSMATLTAMTAAVGTPAYMAPELVQGNEMIDSVEAGKAVDVFSFAMLMLELYTRERPYINMTFNNSYHLMMRVCEGLRPDIPDGTNGTECTVIPDVSQLCKRCWHQEATTRPSFEEIVLTLKLLERKEQRGDGN